MIPQTQTIITVVTPPDIIDVPREASRVVIVSRNRSVEIMNSLVAHWEHRELAVFHGDDFSHPSSCGWLLNRAACADFVVIDLDHADENLLIVIGALFRSRNTWLVGSEDPTSWNTLVRAWAERKAHEQIESCVASLVQRARQS